VLGLFVLLGLHFALSAQYAADILPLAMLLTETNSFNLIAFLGHNNMTFGRMTWRFLGLIESLDSSSF
jgi:hypothetical protein